MAKALRRIFLFSYESNKPFSQYILTDIKYIKYIKRGFLVHLNITYHDIKYNMCAKSN